MAAVSSSLAPGAAAASSTAVRRLRRDLEALQRSQNPQISVQPSEDNLLEWHFVLHSLPADTPYHKGCYHGKILFAPEYPHKPPAILMVTPSGRLETGRRLCLSMTDFHPESWNPAWSVETILVGLLSFFIADERGYGAIQATEARRRQLAEQSWALNAASPAFAALFPEFLAASHAAEEDTAVPCASPSCLEITDETDAQREGRPANDPGHQQEAMGGADLESGASFQPAEEARPEAHQQEEDNEAPTECWICRDTSTAEPLIQPCACRGSMSGVHATCVEEWIRHHRRNAVNDEVPRCSVCHQQYHGYERRPGVADFLRQKCYDLAMQTLRMLVLVFLLIGYQAAGSKKLDMPLVVRVLLVVAFAVPAVHKLVVLMVSLPPHRLPPHNQVLQRFFVADFKLLAMHMAEAFATVSVMGLWCLFGMLPLMFFLPLLAASLALAVKLCFRNPSLGCLRRAGKIVLCIVLSPILLIWLVMALMVSYPRVVFHPLGPGPHLALAIAVVLMAWTCDSNLPLLVLWGTHAAFILAGLLEKLLVKRLRWQSGPVWWFALQMALMGCYASNVCVFPGGIGSEEQSQLIVAGSSAAWLLLVVALAVNINWALCVQYYRTWQHRHGTFTLQVSPQAQEPLQP